MLKCTIEPTPEIECTNCKLNYKSYYISYEATIAGFDGGRYVCLGCFHYIYDKENISGTDLDVLLFAINVLQRSVWYKTGIVFTDDEHEW